MIYRLDLSGKTGKWGDVTRVSSHHFLWYLQWHLPHMNDSSRDNSIERNIKESSKNFGPKEYALIFFPIDDFLKGDFILNSEEPWRNWTEQNQFKESEMISIYTLQEGVWNKRWRFRTQDNYFKEFQKISNQVSENFRIYEEIWARRWNHFNGYNGFLNLVNSFEWNEKLAIWFDSNISHWKLPRIIISMKESGREEAHS